MRKIKKLVATLLAATMVMAMGVTAFAADSLADGKYTAKQNLYKNSACTTSKLLYPKVQQLVLIDTEEK